MLSRRELLLLLALFAASLPAVTARLYSSDEVEYFSYLRSLWFNHDVSFETSINTSSIIALRRRRTSIRPFSSSKRRPVAVSTTARSAARFSGRRSMALPTS